MTSSLLKWRFQQPALSRLGRKPVLTQGVESEVDMATALTRARQARLPSPWTGRGIQARAQNRYRLRWREAPRSFDFVRVAHFAQGDSKHGLGRQERDHSYDQLLTQDTRTTVSRTPEPTYVATALTRARQARLPSPWTGRGIQDGRKKEPGVLNNLPGGGVLCSAFRSFVYRRNRPIAPGCIATKGRSSRPTSPAACHRRDA